MKKIIFFLILFSVVVGLPMAAQAGLANRLSGRIVINVEKDGEAWYIYPENNRRYYLGRPDDAFNIMRELGLGISESNFEKISQAGESEEGLIMLKNLAGQILIRVDVDGEAWYVDPVDLEKHYLGRPDDAFNIMRELGLGINRLDLARIHKPSLDESLNQYSSYSLRKRISSSMGDFYVDVVEIDLDNPDLEIVTETASNANCQRNCPAKSLGEYVLDNDGFAGINATYFNTSAAKRNYYFFPVYNSNLGKMINEDQLIYWTTGPIMAFDVDNNFYYFKDSREFKGVDYFEDKYDTQLQAALGNKPRLIENKMNLLIDWEIDNSQKNIKSWRTALAYKKDDDGGKGKIFLVVARQATVPDLAEILKAMEVDYALNLDGGGSTALFYNDEYMIGPGRDIPNAIIFKEN